MSCLQISLHNLYLKSQLQSFFLELGSWISFWFSWIFKELWLVWCFDTNAPIHNLHTYLQFIPFDLLTQQIRYNRFIFVRLYFFHLISRSLDVSIHEGKVDKFFHWHPHACSLLFAYQPWVSRKPEEHGRDGCQEVSRIWEYYRFAPCMELELSPLDEVALFLCHHWR